MPSPKRRQLQPQDGQQEHDDLLIDYLTAVELGLRQLPDTPETLPPVLAQETQDPTVSDPTVRHLLKRGIPVTVESWLDFNYPDNRPDPIPADLMLEAEQAVASVKQED